MKRKSDVLIFNNVSNEFRRKILCAIVDKTLYRQHDIRLDTREKHVNGSARSGLKTCHLLAYISNFWEGIIPKPSLPVDFPF